MARYGRRVNASVSLKKMSRMKTGIANSKDIGFVDGK